MKVGYGLAMALLVGAVCVVGCGSGGGDGGGDDPRGRVGFFSREGMDFDKDGKTDACFIESIGDTKRISVELPAESGRTVEVASPDTEIYLVIICDYDGDGNLDVVYSLADESPSFWFIPRLDRSRSLRGQVQHGRVEGEGMPVDSFSKIENGFVVKGDGAGGFAAPGAL